AALSWVSRPLTTRFSEPAAQVMKLRGAFGVRRSSPLWMFFLPFFDPCKNQKEESKAATIAALQRRRATSKRMRRTTRRAAAAGYALPFPECPSPESRSRPVGEIVEFPVPPPTPGKGH